MGPDLENLEQRIDRDRRAEERDLLAFLLALFARARDHVYAALRVGASPFEAARDVLMGNPALGLAGGHTGLARRLVSADVAGYRRTTLVLPSVSEPPPSGGVAQGSGSYAPAADYRSYAAQSMAQMLGTLNRRLLPAIADVSGKGLRGRQDAARGVFTANGYVDGGPSGPWLLESVATTFVGQAYNSGWYAGWTTRPEAAEQLTAFRYVSVLDPVTTVICRAYDGVTLPVDHPWWRTHWAPNHWGCRAIIRPTFRPVVYTPEPPWTPQPGAGFGIAPSVAFGLRYVRAA